MRVGIVGAGIAGLACAHGLVRRGHDVVLFDKGRGPGGRMSTRRMPTPRGLAYFDHGAQYFTMRDNDFRSQVDAWISDGIAAAWPAAGPEAYVGVPGMNAPVRDLASRHQVYWSTRVTSLQWHRHGWRLSVEGGDSHDVDLAVIAIPAEQSALLLASTAPDLAARAGIVVSDPCWTVMAAFGEPVAGVADCWRADAGVDNGADGAIGWAARNSAKPGRTGPESWVLQATPGWSRRHLDADPDGVIEGLIAEFSSPLHVQPPDRIAAAAHLWRFARCAPGGPGPFFDAERRLGVCGDWLVGPRVESAWLSGARLAELVASAGR
jgi:predicted NAD/FAD-dependent oxidoreductase